MGHKLHAVLGPRAAVAEFASRWVLARLVELNQGFAMVPLSAALHDDIAELANLRTPDPHPGFERLSPGVEAALRLDASRAGPVGYIETDYFGGVGEQRAIAWRAGEVLVGPFFSKTEWRDDGPHTEPPGERAVNRVLSVLGVVTSERTDAFDALALGRYRDTESLATKRV
jgi:hypothetical protein